jgi:hypothetical protein
VGIARNQFSFYLEIFSIPGFLAEPLATLGYQVIIGKDLPEDLPEEFKFGDMKQLLDSRGITDVTAIDLFDERADLRYDLNFPVPSTEEERYRTVCDLGTLEHVFDTRQCMENCMRMVKPGGHYLLCTPVIGWHRHGLHTFNPELIIGGFLLNGFDIEYLRYSTSSGVAVEELEYVQTGLPDEHARFPPRDTPNCLIWIVGRKTSSLDVFQVPQQGRWARAYPPSRSQGSESQEASWISPVVQDGSCFDSGSKPSGGSSFSQTTVHPSQRWSAKGF